MAASPLPHGTRDVLDMPPSDMPNVIRRLTADHKLSGLVSRIHRDLHSNDPARRSQGALALKRLGFPE